MLSRPLAVLAVITCCAILIAAPAQAVNLQSNWYAQLTNVRTYGGTYSMDPFPGLGTSSAHIGVPEFSIPSGQATFDVLQTGEAPLGESADWGTMTLWDENTLGSISFDYHTYWTSPNLMLVLEALDMRLEAPRPSQIVWSTATTGSRTGHVAIENVNPNGYYFHLVVVPEPGSLSGLASLCGASLLGLRRMRRQSS